MSDAAPPEEKIVKGNEGHEAAARAFEITVVRMMMAADKPDEVHPMMKGALRAAASMALQFIATDESDEALDWLVDDLEKDCVDIIDVLRKAMAARKATPT